MIKQIKFCSQFSVAVKFRESSLLHLEWDSSSSSTHTNSWVVLGVIWPSLWPTWLFGERSLIRGPKWLNNGCGNGEPASHTHNASIPTTQLKAMRGEDISLCCEHTEMRIPADDDDDDDRRDNSKDRRRRQLNQQ